MWTEISSSQPQWWPTCSEEMCKQQHLYLKVSYVQCWCFQCIFCKTIQEGKLYLTSISDISLHQMAAQGELTHLQQEINEGLSENYNATLKNIYKRYESQMIKSVIFTVKLLCNFFRLFNLLHVLSFSLCNSFEYQ